jgi:hypothetical protein
MIGTVEAAQEIRKGLKAAGIKARSVSVRCDLYSMGSSIYVRIKDPTVSLAKVKAIAENFEKVDRDAYSGEILSGGNRFVTVEFSDEATEALAAPHRDAILAIPNDGRAVEVGAGFLGVALTNGYDERVFIFRPGDFDHPVVQCYGREFAARQFGEVLATTEGK